MNEMVDRLARVIDPKAFVEQSLEPAVDADIAELLYIARRERAKISARLYIFAMREPTALMKERGETRWREMIDLVLDEEFEGLVGSHAEIARLMRK